MSILLQSDDFGRTGGLGSNWLESTLAGANPFELDGDKALAPRYFVQNGISGGNPVWVAGHARGIFKTFDPGIVFPLTQFTSGAGGPTQKLTVSIRVTMPSTLPSAPDELRASAVFLGEAVSSTLDALELQYAINSSGTHLLRVVRRLASGTEIVQAGSSRNLTTQGVALSAGESATLYARIIFNNLFVFQVETWWESPTDPAAAIVLAQYHQFTLNWQVVPPSANPGPGSETFYCGILAVQEGPRSGGGNTAPPEVTARLAIDNFQVTDDRSLDAFNLFPQPALAGAQALVRVPLTESEIDAVSSSLAVLPSFAIDTTYQQAVREHRADDGTLITHARDVNPRRLWSLAWTSMTDAESAALEAQVAEAMVSKKSFSWTIAGTDEVVAFVFKGAPTFTSEAKGVWSASAEVEEVRA